MRNYSIWDLIVGDGSDMFLTTLVYGLVYPSLSAIVIGALVILVNRKRHPVEANISLSLIAIGYLNYIALYYEMLTYKWGTPYHNISLVVLSLTYAMLVLVFVFYCVSVLGKMKLTRLKMYEFLLGPLIFLWLMTRGLIFLFG